LSNSRALEHLALVVGTVLVLKLLGKGLDLVDGVRDTNKVTPGNAVERVAGGADLTVDCFNVRIGRLASSRLAYSLERYTPW
jgi:hypothetical protein